MKTRKHKNILHRRDIEEHRTELQTFEFECRGCTMLGRDIRWDGYISSTRDDELLNSDNSYLMFEEELFNIHDPNAIMVMIKGEMFGLAGYVGREFTREIKDILRQCSLYRIDMKDRDECGKKTINLVMTWVGKSEK